MFYKSPYDQIIRQGDIIKGLISPEIITNKFLDNNEKDFGGSFSIAVKFNYVTTITPCCNIQKSDYIALCPLIPLRKDFRLESHKFIFEDPTRINRLIAPEKSVPPIAWEKKISSKEKQIRIERGPTYIYLNNFVFEKYGDILSENMMIDFDNIFNIRRKDLGNGNQKLLSAKVLQLSDEIRNTLREKLVAYYFKIPEENDDCKLSA